MQYPLRWIVPAVVLMAASCSGNKSKTLEVNGTIQHIDEIAASYPGAVRNGKITLGLYEIPLGHEAQPIQLDTVSIPLTEKTFQLEGPVTSEGILYNLMVLGGPALPLINDSKSISVNIDLADKDRFYTVNGSTASEQLKDFIFTYGEQRTSLEQTMQSLDSLKLRQAPDSIVLGAIGKKNDVMNKLNAYLKSFLGTANQPTLAYFALGRSAETLPPADFEASMNQIIQKFPQDSNLTSMKASFEAYKSRKSVGGWVGKKAPELVLPDANGKSIALSSFKGKYVLVDFWASWCDPCRKENPNVVNAYLQFKDKNFTVLGVSLDEKKDRWLGAVNKDHLTWTQVSDLAYWDSKAVSIFGFDGIPYNVLVDPEGTIIAEKLRGNELETKLAEVLK